MLLKLMTSAVLATCVAHADPIYNVNSIFGQNLYEKILTKNENQGNQLLSPVSAAVALQMAYSGATNLNATEMNYALSIGDWSVNILADYNAELIAAYNSHFMADNGTYNLNLKMANAAFINSDYNKGVNPEFVNFISSKYGAKVSSLPFSAPEDTAEKINAWSADATNDKIKDIVQPDGITSDQVMMLLNAVYVAGKWQYPFEAELTADAQFSYYDINGDKKTISTPTMTVDGVFSIDEGTTSKAIRVPLKEGPIAFYAIQPKNMSVDPYMQFMNGANIPKILDGIKLAEPTYVQFNMPKFKYESTMDLAEVLKSLGMESAFEAGHDASTGPFLGISDDPTLHISSVKQKTYIDVNEGGLEAAAVTAIGFAAESMVVSPDKSFSIDGSFVYFLYDETTKQVLFMGTVYRP